MKNGNSNCRYWEKIIVVDHTQLLDNGDINMIERLVSIWNYKVLIIDSHPVTVSKLVGAIIIVISGIIAVRIFNRTMGNRLFKKFNFRETTTLNIRKILNYFAYVMILLFALRLINVPLTAFAFLGGAIAIGVGFGAQNLINNFISGASCRNYEYFPEIVFGGPTFIFFSFIFYFFTRKMTVGYF